MLPLWSFAAFQWVRVDSLEMNFGAGVTYVYWSPTLQYIVAFLDSFWVLFVPFLCLWFKLKITVSMINRFQCDFQTSLKLPRIFFFLLFVPLFLCLYFVISESTVFTAGGKWVIPIFPIVVRSGWMSPLYNLFKQILLNWNESRQENVCDVKCATGKQLIQDIASIYSFYIYIFKDKV